MAKLAKELLPAVDNLDRALDGRRAATATTATRRSSSGIKLVHADVIAALARVGIEPFSPEGEQFDPQHHEAIAQQPVEGAQPGHGRRGLPARLPARRLRAAAGARRRAPDRRRHAMADATRLLQDPRGRQERLRRGDQEGLPQARAPVPPGPQPRRQEGRGALQGDLAGARRPVRSRQAQGV